jgi:hypothetical protein
VIVLLCYCVIFMPKRSYKRRRKKFSSWKKLKVSKKIRHRLKIFGLAFVVVFATIVVSGAVALYQFFKKPMATATGAVNGDVTIADGRFNLLLINLEDASDPASLAREISVITLSPDEREAFVVRLPLESEVLVPQGFGGHKLKEVYSLGALTKPQANLNLTAQTVKQLLAVPIDGYIVTDDAGLGQIGQYLGGGWQMVRLLPNLLTEVRRQIKTNLTFPTLLRVGRFVLSARSDEDVWEISQEELFDWQHLDLELQKHFIDSQIVEERLKIQVLNATEESGLATHVARYVKNLGGDVIILGNYDQTDLRQGFLVTSQEESWTVRRLKEVLQIEEVGLPASQAEALRAGERADLTIILGLDSWKNL